MPCAASTSREFVLGAQIHRAEPLAVGAQRLQPALDFRTLRKLGPRRDAGQRDQLLRSRLQFLRDRAINIGGALAGRLQLRLAAGLLLTGGAHRLERASRGAVAFGEAGFAQRARVGGLAPIGFGGLDRRDERAALMHEGLRRLGQFLLFHPRRLKPLLELADAVLSLVAALHPRGALAQNRGPTRRARRDLVAESRQRRPGLASLRPLGHRPGAQALQGAGEKSRLVERIQRLQRDVAFLRRLVSVGEDLRLGFLQRRKPLGDLRVAAFRGAVARSRFIQTRARAPLRLARFALHHGGFPRRLARHLRRFAGLVGLRPGDQRFLA